MAEAWFIKVEGREYGPAELDRLREWKDDGRVLSTNEARAVDTDVWVTAAEIPGLFESDATLLPAPPAPPSQPPRGFLQILGDTVRIYFRGFFQFLYLTLLVLLPSICAQLSGSAISPSSVANSDTGAVAAAAFTFCMTGLSLAARPVFIIGIQLLTAELIIGRKPSVFALFGDIMKFWPRVAMLCIFVYGIFFLLSVFALAIMALIVVGGSSAPVVILVALILLCVQVWMFGRFYINVLFWQQFAVLEDLDIPNSLRRSKELARSGRQLPWFQRPIWRGVFISSLWMAFGIALSIGPEWASIRQYFHLIMTTTDPHTVLESLRAASNPQGFNAIGFALGLVQTVLKPLLGIAFVLLYLESKLSQ